MLPKNTELPRGLVFRQFLPFFLIKVYALAAWSAVCFERVLRTGGRWWLAMLLLSVTVAVLLVARYFADSVTVYDSFIVIEQGSLKVSTIVIPLWQLRFTTTQSLVGRICRYGSIHLTWDGKEIDVTGIAGLKAFQVAVLQRQEALLAPMLMQAQIVARYQPHVLTRESQDDLDYYR